MTEHVDLIETLKEADDALRILADRLFPV